MGSSTVAQAKLGSNEAKSTEWIQMILQDGLRRGAVEHQSDSHTGGVQRGQYMGNSK